MKTFRTIELLAPRNPMANRQDAKNPALGFVTVCQSFAEHHCNVRDSDHANVPVDLGILAVHNDTVMPN